MDETKIQKTLETKDFREVEKKLREFFLDPIARDVFWRMMDFRFSEEKSNDVIRDNWWKLYRLYVDICWKKMPMLHIDFVTSDVFTRQLLMGIILGYEPIDVLIWYLGTRFVLEEEQISEYKKIKDNIFESNFSLGVYKKEKQTLSHIIKEIDTLNSRGNPELELAEFKAKLEETFFSEIPTDVDLSSINIDKKNTVITFFSFVHFLLGVKPTSIPRFVEVSLNGDDYVEELTSDLSEKINPYQSIKIDLEQKFPYDENGELSPLEDVLETLSNLAEERKDENIEELYMFDEDENKFVWNEELLNQN